MRAEPVVSPLATHIPALKGFRPDVQALRGIAVLAVVLYHAGLVRGGYVGVDVFFVISGFVIGRVLLAQLDVTGRVSFGGFFSRRVRRLLPALTTMLVLVLLLAPLLAPFSAGRVTQQTGVAAALFNANTYLYLSKFGGYFGTAAELNPLMHTWSLSVEEQFYLVMPALLLGAWKLSIRRGRSLAAVRWFAAVVVIGSFVACVALTSGLVLGPVDGIRFAFYSPVTRAWEFAAGLALVVIPVRSLMSVKVRRVAVIVGLALVAFAILGFSDATTFPGMAAAVPVVGTVLVIFGGTTRAGEASPIRWLHQRPLIWLGDLSYSWYLWHWPLIVFAVAYWPQAGQGPLVAAAALSLLPAWLSRKAVERRFQSTSAPRLRRTVAIAGCCIVAPLFVAGVVWVVDSSVYEHDAVQRMTVAHDLHIDGTSGCDVFAEAWQRPDAVCTWGSDRPASIVLVGDSNAGHLSEALIGAAEANGTSVRLATSSSCPILDLQGEDVHRVSAECIDHVRSTLQEFEADPPEVVVVAGSTDGYLREGLFSLPAEATLSPEERGARKAAAYEDGLTRTLARLRAAGSRVVLVNVLPKPGGGRPGIGECSTLAMVTAPDHCLPETFQVEDSSPYLQATAVEDRAAAAAGVEVWDLSEAVCPGGVCTARVDGRVVYRDGSHISVATSEALASTVAELLRGAPAG